MSGRKSRNKGARIEREIVTLHRELGIHAERVPLSGACGGSFGGDVIIPGVGTVEVKCRAGGGGFKTIEGWLADNAALFLRRDRQSPLVVLPWATWERLVTRTGDNKVEESRHGWKRQGKDGWP